MRSRLLDRAACQAPRVPQYFAVLWRAMDLAAVLADAQSTAAMMTALQQSGASGLRSDSELSNYKTVKVLWR
jgi:hypothetical protein